MPGRKRRLPIERRLNVRLRRRLSAFEIKFPKVYLV